MVRRMCKLLPGLLNSIVNEPIGSKEITRACVQKKLYGPIINSMFNTKFDIFLCFTISGITMIACTYCNRRTSVYRGISSALATTMDSTRSLVIL